MSTKLPWTQTFLGAVTVGVIVGLIILGVQALTGNRQTPSQARSETATPASSARDTVTNSDNADPLTSTSIEDATTMISEASILARETTPDSRTNWQHSPTAAVASAERTPTPLTRDAARVARNERYAIFTASALPNSSQTDDVAVIVTDEQGALVGELIIAISHTLSTSTRKVSSPFSRSFFDEGAHRLIYDGRGAELLKRCQATSVVDALLLGILRQRYTKQSGQLEGLVTADLTLTLRAISADLGEIRMQYDVQARGVAFHQDEARQQAIQRLMNDVTKRLVSYPER